MSKKGFHTFLFADLTGYSILTELHGDEAAADLAIRFTSEVWSLAGEHDAEVIKRIGDAVMVRGEDAAETIQLGLRLHEELTAEKGLPPIHAGIHTGPAVQRGGEWWGATVNLASRVADAADGGELLITEATAQAAGEMGSTQLHSLGPKAFKNISFPVWVYSAARRSEAVFLDPHPLVSDFDGVGLGACPDREVARAGKTLCQSQGAPCFAGS
jgi:adenylate cyclase